MTVDSVHRTLVSMWKDSPAKIDRLVISGGEPMAQVRTLIPLINRIRPTFKNIEIETSGVIPLPLKLSGVYFNVSPKLLHAQTKRPYNLDVLREYARRSMARFKFVVQDVSDFDEVDLIVSSCNLPHDRVWIMPLGVGRHELMERTQRIADEVIKRGYNLTTRLHILMWGNRRGV